MNFAQITVKSHVTQMDRIDMRSLENNLKGEDLEEKLSYLLTFAKFIGIYPHGSLLDRVIRVIPLALSIVAVVDLIGINLLNPKSIRTATDIAGDFGVPGFYSLGTFLYFYIQRNIYQLHEIFTRWKRLEVRFPDAHLKRFVNISSLSILASAILENVSFHFKLFPVFESPSTYCNKSSLEVYYQRSHSHWAIYVPFHSVVAIMLLITNKWALYAWNFADVLVAVLCRALYFRFSVLLRDRDPETMEWESVRGEYMSLVNIANKLERFLSPVIFGCYALNTYAICMQLHMWLTPSQSQHYLHTLYLAWSFVHLLGRVLFVSVNAAKVHEEIKRFEREVQMCPDEKYSMEIERLEICSKAANRGLGLTGLGCFLITKPFILSLFSVAFTFEVFLLQSDTIKLR